MTYPGTVKETWLQLQEEAAANGNKASIAFLAKKNPVEKKPAMTNAEMQRKVNELMQSEE